MSAVREFMNMYVLGYTLIFERQLLFSPDIGSTWIRKVTLLIQKSQHPKKAG